MFEEDRLDPQVAPPTHSGSVECLGRVCASALRIAQRYPKISRVSPSDCRQTSLGRYTGIGPHSLVRQIGIKTRARPSSFSPAEAPECVNRRLCKHFWPVANQDRVVTQSAADSVISRPTTGCRHGASDARNRACPSDLRLRWSSTGVIAVIGILVGLLLPAMQQAREAAGGCNASKHKQLALATQAYEKSWHLPPSGIVEPKT